MPNITLSVDEDTIKKVRKIAIDKNTTLTAMVRDFLGAVAERGASGRERAIAALDDTFDELARDMGEHGWTRDELHER